MWDFEINTIGGSTKSLVRVEGLIGGGHQGWSSGVSRCPRPHHLGGPSSATPPPAMPPECLHCHLWPPVKSVFLSINVDPRSCHLSCTIVSVNICLGSMVDPENCFSPSVPLIATWPQFCPLARPTLWTGFLFYLDSVSLVLLMLIWKCWLSLYLCMKLEILSQIAVWQAEAGVGLKWRTHRQGE